MRSCCQTVLQVLGAIFSCCSYQRMVRRVRAETPPHHWIVGDQKNFERVMRARADVGPAVQDLMECHSIVRRDPRNHNILCIPILRRVTISFWRSVWYALWYWNSVGPKPPLQYIRSTLQLHLNSNYMSWCDEPHNVRPTNWWHRLVRWYHSSPLYDQHIILSGETEFGAAYKAVCRIHLEMAAEDRTAWDVERTIFAQQEAIDARIQSEVYDDKNVVRIFDGFTKLPRWGLSMCDLSFQFDSVMLELSDTAPPRHVPCSYTQHRRLMHLLNLLCESEPWLTVRPSDPDRLSAARAMMRHEDHVRAAERDD